ncbi:unnamed protein product, partial [Mesorhabditis spiculigera]
MTRDGSDSREHSQEGSPCEVTLQDVMDEDKLVVLNKTDQLWELHTILKDRTTQHPDYVFYADRLMRLVVEEGLNRLPITEKRVVTPTMCPYKGIAFARGNCGVAVCPGGDAMEIALRQCCRSIRLCKILLDDIEHKVIYTRFTKDLAHRRCLVLYPTITNGMFTKTALDSLLKKGVLEENIYLVTLFATPRGVIFLRRRYPKMCIITSEITEHIVKNFAKTYFGTS